MRSHVRLAGTVLLISSLAAIGVVTPANAAHHRGKLITSRVIALGRILTNSHHRTIYIFSRDTPGTSHCGRSCRRSWPPVLSAGKPRAGIDVRQRRLHRTPRHQVTYYGHPLYYFSGDSGRSHAGEGLSEFGGKWHVVSTKGTPIKPRSSTGGTGGTGGGGTPPPPYLPPAPSGPASLGSGTLTASSTNVLVDAADDHTLYSLQGESGTAARFYCVGDCQKTWRPLLTTSGGKIPVSGAADSSLVGTVTRTDDNNEIQVTYNDHPLYRYAGDAAAGADNGEFLYTGPYVWYAMAPSGNFA